MEVRDRCEDLFPVPAHLVGTAEGTLRMRRCLTDHARVEGVHEGLEIVSVHRIAESPEQHQSGIADLIVHLSHPPIQYRQTYCLVVILRV
jgi:hypothetical protein